MAYPYLVKIAWDVVNAFIMDWQRNPYLWPMERDIHVELATRMRSLYQNIGRDILLGNYAGAVAGFEQNQWWSRVACEHTITYTYEDGKRYKCRPDIIVWDDIDNPDSPPDAIGQCNWPILWLCEIKFGANKVDTWDIEKMAYLLTGGDAKYGCWLKFFLERAPRGNGVVWEKTPKHNRLWSCEIRLPAK